DLDLAKTITPVFINAGGEIDEENPELQVLLDLSDALVMSRPKAVRENQYPDVELKLKNIQDTLAELKKAKEGQIIKPKNRFKDQEGLKICGPKQGGSGGTGGEGDRPGGPGMAGPGSGGSGMAPPRPGGSGNTSPPGLPSGSGGAGSPGSAGAYEKAVAPK